MNRTLVLVMVVLPIAVVLGLFIAERLRTEIDPTSTTREVGGKPLLTAPTDKKAGLLDLGQGARAEDFFAAPPATIVRGADDIETSWQRLFFAARRLDTIGTGLFRAEGLTIITNPPPDTPAARNRQVTIPTALSGSDAQLALAGVFGQVTGVTADLGEIDGSVDLSTLKSLKLTGRVVSLWVDPENFDDRIQLASEELTILFVGTTAVRATTSSTVVISRPGRHDLEIRGRGADLQFATHDLRVDHDIVVDLRDPKLLGVPGGPVVVAAGGPLTFSTPGPHTATRPESGPVDPRSHIEIGGRVHMTQGPMVFEGDRADLRLGRTGNDHTSDLDILGNVSFDSERISVSGSRLHEIPGKTAADRQFVLDGQPIVGRLRNAALPGAAGSGAGDVVFTTAAGAPARATVTPMPDEGGFVHVRRLVVGPGVTVTGQGLALDAKTITQWIGDTPGGGDIPARTRLPFRTLLAGDAHGHVPGATLTAKTARIDRAFDDDGMVTTEKLALDGPYEVVWTTADGIAAAQPASRGVAAPVRDQGLMARARRLIARGPGTLVVDRTARPGAPTVVTADKGSEMRLEREAAGDAVVVVNATTTVASLQLKADAAGPRHALNLLTADKNVVVDIPQRAHARGAALRYDPAVQEIVLDGALAAQARIDMVSRDGSPPDTLRADHVVYTDTTGRMTATGAVTGNARLPGLAWIGLTTPPGPVASTIAAHKATLDFERDRPTSDGAALREIRLDGGVRMTQPDRTLTCDAFRFTSATRSGAISGQPAKYLVKRPDGTQTTEDRLLTPRATFTGDQFVAEGPVDATVLVAPYQLALAPAARNSVPTKTGPVPMHITSRGDLVATREFVRAGDHAVVKQGDPDVAGFKMSADETTLFLAPEGARTGPLLDVALALLKGHAIYESRDLSGSGDVMEFDRFSHKTSVFNERPEKVTLRINGDIHESTVHMGGSRIEADMHDPLHPMIYIWDGRGELAPASRRLHQ